MLNWLKSILSIAIGGLDDLWRKVLSVITTIYNTVWGYIQDLYRSVVQISDDIGRLSDSFSSWIAHTYHTFTTWVSQQFSAVLKWADNAIKSVEHDLSTVVSWASNQLATLGHYIDSLVDDAKNWVLNDVWKPLYNDVTGTINWIEKEGAYVYNLITHPDLFIALFMSYIWSAWLSLFKTYTKPIVSFILANLKNAVPDVVSVMEDILSSLFLPELNHGNTSVKMGQ